MTRLLGIIQAFLDGWHCGVKRSCQEDKDMRNHLSEKQVDRMLKDSFPASDPPSTY